MVFDGDNIVAVLNEHKDWLQLVDKIGMDNYNRLLADDDPEHSSCPRPADFSNKLLTRIIFVDFLDLSGANFEEATIVRCCFNGNSIFNNASFKSAVIHNSDFLRADLSGAIFDRAWITHCDFSFANIKRASFGSANIVDSSFHFTDLEKADFTEATIYGDTIFEGASLTKTKMPLIPMTCPEKGDFIGWKIAFAENPHPTQEGSTSYVNVPVLVKLKIPSTAKRTSGSGRKCRCSKAEVIDIMSLKNQNVHLTEAHSWWKPSFRYKIGDIIKPEDPFCTDRWYICSSGIHFFLNKKEAIEYGKQWMFLYDKYGEQ